jgi:hypothetical protein
VQKLAANRDPDTNVECSDNSLACLKMQDIRRSVISSQYVRAAQLTSSASPTTTGPPDS